MVMTGGEKNKTEKREIKTITAEKSSLFFW